MAYSIEYFHPRIEQQILRWPAGIVARYTRLVELLAEFGPELGMPYSKALGSGLFELRPRGPEGIGRALYCFISGRRVVVLHTFIKKTQATPRKELELARKRMKEIRRG